MNEEDGVLESLAVGSNPRIRTAYHYGERAFLTTAPILVLFAGLKACR